MKNNSHIGYIVAFVIAVIAFIAFSVPKLKEQEAKRAVDQERRDSAALERAWEIADSVKHEELMEDPDYRELYEEVQDLRRRVEDIENRSE